jgi:hypothetical protein
MTPRAWIQLAALVAMTLLAAAVLYLISDTYHAAVDKMTPDGKVPLADAGLFTALLLSFREVIAMISKLWDHEERVSSTEALSNSLPTATPNPPIQQGASA